MMKHLLKLLVVVLLVSMASTSFSQNYRLKAGLNLSTMAFKDPQGNVTTPSKLKPGINVGVTAEFLLSDLFAFETGLMLSSKGLKMDGTTNETATIAPLYLEIPLNIKKSFDLTGVKIYGTFGPYLGIGVGGKIKYKTATETQSSSIVYGSSSNDDLKTMDFGLAASAGIEVSAFQLGVSYGLGLSNILPGDQGNGSIKNKVIGITVGYKFAGK